MPIYKKGKYYWSKRELQELDERFPFESNKTLAKYFDINWRTLVRKARELNLQKHELFRIQFDFKEFAKKGATHPNSMKTRFKKGNHTSIETEFKKGHNPFFMKMSYLQRKLYQNEKNLG